jgi:putative addiction module component (TIGR02574 family)
MIRFLPNEFSAGTRCWLTQRGFNSTQAFVAAPTSTLDPPIVRRDKKPRLLAGLPRVTMPIVTKGARQLLEDALKLELDERAALAAELIESLDPETDEDAEAAWAAEIERRAARARSGEDPGIPWSEVRERLQRGLAKR